MMQNKQLGFTCNGMCKCASNENNDCWIEEKDQVFEEKANDEIFENDEIFFYVEILLRLFHC